MVEEEEYFTSSLSSSLILRHITVCEREIPQQVSVSENSIDFLHFFFFFSSGGEVVSFLLLSSVIVLMHFGVSFVVVLDLFSNHDSAIV